MLYEGVAILLLLQLENTKSSVLLEVLWIEVGGFERSVFVWIILRVSNFSPSSIIMYSWLYKCDCFIMVTASLEYLKSAFTTRGHVTISYFHCASIINVARPIIRMCGHHDQLLLRGMVDCY